MDRIYKSIPDICPKCNGKFNITNAEFWSGKDESGTPVGGGIFDGKCEKCNSIFTRTSFPSGESDWSEIDI